MESPSCLRKRSPLPQGLRRKGVHPDDLKTLADLAKFPFTTKADLRDNYPFGMFAVPREKVARVHASSGTTGKPTVVGYTLKDIDTWATVMARSIRAAGGRAGDMVHVAYGYGLFTGGLGAHYGAEKLGCTVVPMSGGQTEKQVQLIQDFKPDVIMVTPSYMLTILDEMDRMGIDPRSTSLKIGIFGAEPWTEAMRQAMQERSGMDAVDIYGLSEVIGPGVANECIETKDGLVIWEDHFYPEIIDPVTGEVLPDGSEGELVFTSLTKEAMPIVRYRTRDLTRLMAPTARSMRRMAKITGSLRRHADHSWRECVPDPDRGAHLQDPQARAALPAGGRQAGASGYAHGQGRDQCGSDVGRHPEQKQALGKELQHHIKSLIGVSATVLVGEPFSIERVTIGKAKRVVDRRPRD
jgi:phenylacetate-CoA ligase